MSIYFNGACHDCKVQVDLGNTHYHENLFAEWVRKDEHEGHNVEYHSEFEDEFTGRITKYKEVPFL